MITPELIYNFKEIHKNLEISFELSNIFDNINELFKTSTQYIENKKRINYNQINHNKWKLKKNETSNIVNIISNCFNRITDSNYNIIFNEIKSSNKINIDDMNKISQKIIKKISSEQQFLKIYINLIYDIITKCLWIIKENNELISFRYVFIKNLQSIFIDLIDKMDIITEKEERIINNNYRTGLMHVIGNLYQKKILPHIVIKYILDDLENKYYNTKNNDYVENWLIIWKYSSNYFSIKESFIKNNYSDFSKRIQFIIDDNIPNNDNNIKQTEILLNDDNIYYNYIDFMDEFNSVNEFLNEINSVAKNNFNQFLNCLLKYTIDNPKDLAKCTNIITCGIKLNLWNNNLIKQLIINIKNHELSNILLDAPYYEKHLDKYLEIII